MSEQVSIIVVDPEQKERRVWAVRGQNLREALVLTGLDPGGTCGGRGTCGKCKVRVESASSPMGAEERSRLLPEEIKAGERLACFIDVNESMTVRVDYSENMKGSKIRPRMADAGRVDPKYVETRRIFIEGLDKQNPVPLYDRLKKAMPGLIMKIPPDNLNDLAALDRQGRPTMELYALIFEGREVKCLSRDNDSAYGIALDLGTTSLQASLVDLVDGEVVSITSQTNLQRVLGEDIISRVSHCLDNPEGLGNLNRILINGVNAMIDELLAESGIPADQIFAFSVVGNPVMLHFFLRFNVNGFGSMPYYGMFYSDYLASAAALGLKANPEATVFLLPQIGGFVGSDTVSGLLSLNALNDQRFLYIDIGTNGEVVIGNRGQFWAASAAAGPAFEGGSITRGMRAVTGAIDRVQIKDGSLSYHVLGGVNPRGLCGSGIIDLVGSLLEGQYLDSMGQFTSLSEERLAMRAGARGLELRLSGKSYPEIVFNQEDVRQLQLAKSAVRTAADILLEKAGMNAKDLNAVFLAGTFGSYVDPEKAVRIGLLPRVDGSIVKNIGNAAAAGAVKALLSPFQQEEARSLAGRIKYIELASQQNFSDLFIKNLNF